MGMDLEPINPAPDAPVDQYGGPKWGRYNWSGWRYLLDLLDETGLDLSEFSGCNDGDVISGETCRKVGKLILDKLPSLPEEDREWLEPHVQLWTTCGGYRQY